MQTHAHLPMGSIPAFCPIMILRAVYCLLKGSFQLSSAYTKPLRAVRALHCKTPVMHHSFPTTKTWTACPMYTHKFLVY